MDLNLILSAQTLRLAPEVHRSEAINGLLVIKNVQAQTYLRVTSAQWRVLQEFREARTVPAVLDRAIGERICLPLGEFFELVLKAMEARILLEPGAEVPVTRASTWRAAVRPATLARPLVLLFFLGLGLAFWSRPALPTSVLDVTGGLLVLTAALSGGAALAACIVRGAAGEVYRPRWQWLACPPCFQVDTGDDVMLPRAAQDVALMARLAVLAAAAGITTWQFPSLSFLPLLGLVVGLRPIFGGRFVTLARFGRERRPSDAEHNFLFPYNRRPAARWRLLRRVLGQSETWVRLAYGVVWTLAVIYLGARLTDTPPWSFAFWEANGERITIAIGGSLLLLGGGYLSWEIFQLARDRARTRRILFRRWRDRWFDAPKRLLDESGRTAAVAASPLLQSQPPPVRQELARAGVDERHRAWRTLADYQGPKPARAALIVSGRVSLRRELSSGRLAEVQVLGEGDLIGFHDLADPQQPDYRLRTLTPLTLLSFERPAAEQMLVRMTPDAMANALLKLPFLRRIPLCQNWHLQAIERFARLSVITRHAEGDVIFSEGNFIRDFFIILEGDAQVVKRAKRIAVLRAGEFFGEIGLLQNSNATASITGRRNTRCLCISRAEFLRFVTHNPTVALELERVSSERLGHPIFPLKKGDFRTM